MKKGRTTKAGRREGRKRSKVRSPKSKGRRVRMPIEFHVKASEWKRMPAKTRAALVEMVKGVVQTTMTGAEQIQEERWRQMDEEDWSPENDDKHTRFQLTLAGISYATAVAHPDEWAQQHGQLPGPTSDWPWAKKWWKPSADPIRNLVKAGALIAAEIDRLQRRKDKV